MKFIARLNNFSKMFYVDASQLYPQLHYWVTAFFTLRIQILSFSGKFILTPKWLSDLPMKEKIKPRLWFKNLELQIAEQFANERKS